jgi:molybdopterin converting factor small subunit
MKIVVKLGAPLSQVVGESKVILAMPEGANISSVLDELRVRYPDFEEGLRGKGLRQPFDRVLYTLFLNARPVPFEQAKDTPLRDGDRVYLFLPVAGG